MDGSIEKSRQPYAGGEVQFIFSYGSTKFDDNMGSTVFTALVCDDCAAKYVDNMTRLTENHRETPPPIPEGFKKLFPLKGGTDDSMPDALEELFPLEVEADDPMSDVLDEEKMMEDVERMLDSQQDEIDSENQPSRNNEY